MIKLVLYAVMLILAIPPVSIAKVKSNYQTIARYDEHGKMVNIFNIFGLKNGAECTYLEMKGNITSVEYDKNKQITNFYIRTNLGYDENIYVTGLTLYKRLPADEVKKLPSLVFKGNTVQLQIYACGASGSHNEADQIAGLK